MIQITFLRDLNGNEHAITAVKKIHSEVNGDEDIRLTIHKQKNSRLDLKEVSEMWTVIQDDIEYKIVLVEQKTQGNGFYLDVRGIPLFYDKFRTSVIHYLYNGSMTATNCFTRIFEGTGYNFVLVNPSYAVEWQGFGKGQTRMELFKRALERYGYEFYIQGSTVYMEHLIGNDTNFEYRYKLNASNIKKSTDATAMITHIKGFGNFEEDEEDYLNNAKLKREATSPLADIVGIREGSPVLDGRITQADTMDERLQRAIDDSLLISVEASLHDVRQMGYETAVPLKGDRSFLVDERIGLNTDIRVQSVTTTKDERDRIIACDVVFGSQSIGNRYKANLSTVSQNMEDLLGGKIQLPMEILAPAAKEMLDKIKSVDTELLLENGIFAIDPNNPNNIVGLNSAGLFISTDGGATAKTVLTSDGIVANAITSGQILTHLVRVVGTEGLFSIDGDVAKWIDASNTNRYVKIEPGKMTMTYGALNILNDDGTSKTQEWDDAEDNAVGRAESYSDGVVTDLKDDLRMTSPLPNSLSLNSNGVTAYTSASDSFARLDYRGLFINKGAIQIQRDDAYTDTEGKRYGVYMQNGKESGEVDVQRNQFMDDAVNWTKQRYQLPGSNALDGQTYNCETIYTSHNRRFIRLGFGMNIYGAASKYVLVELVEFTSGTTMSTHRQFVSESGGTHWNNISIDMGVPDYVSDKSFYVKIGLEGPTDRTYLQVVVNRVSMYG